MAFSCFVLWAGGWAVVADVAEATDLRAEVPHRAVPHRAVPHRAVPHRDIIAELDVPFRPEGELDAAATEVQRLAFARAQDALLTSLAGEDVTLVRRYVTVPFLALRAGSGSLMALERSPLVRAVAENRRLFVPDERAPAVPTPGPSLEAGPSDPAGAETSNHPWGTDRVNAPAGWAMGYDGTGQSVAVLDTGFDTRHPYLGRRVAYEACFSTAADCPRGTEAEAGPGTAANCSYHSGCWHGTHVAGVAAGSYGVAKGADLIAVRVFQFHRGARAAPTTNTADVVSGMEFVHRLSKDQGVAVAALNLSLGAGRFSQPCADDPDSAVFRAAMANLLSVGVLTVAASGNDGFVDSMWSPACVPSAVSVGNTTQDDRVHQTSNSVGYLSLLAPGTDISSSIPGGDYGIVTGTSPAAPHVTGALAVLAQLSPARTEAGASARLRALLQSGRLITDARNQISTPRIDVAEALDALSVTAANG